uniref:TNFR-Cys domain-containing protein n=1 Tax=Paramormyrops kingsleyae TaxID=1676925 RepID=A0A3B3SX12_9TELE
TALAKAISTVYFESLVVISLFHIVIQCDFRELRYHCISYFLFPGSYVNRHCTAWTSTSCAPCIGSTFNDQPNDLEQCSPCTVCDGGNISVQACTPSSDTVCGVLEGHYCIIPYKGGCRAAHKHTACKPGQFIKQPEYTDTVCEDCSDNSYSDGSFTSCKPHTE